MKTSVHAVRTPLSNPGNVVRIRAVFDGRGKGFTHGSGVSFQHQLFSSFSKPSMAQHPLTQYSKPFTTRMLSQESIKSISFPVDIQHHKPRYHSGFPRWNIRTLSTAFVHGQTQASTSASSGADPNQKDKKKRDPAKDLFKLSLEISRASPPIDTTIKCTEYGPNGTVVRIGHDFQKSEMIGEFGLQARDLRKLDSNSSTLPYIFVRPTTILVNLLQLRVLIQSDRVLVVDADECPAHVKNVFAYNLENRLSEEAPNKAPKLPYELRALEAVLISVSSGLEAELVLVRDPVVKVLQDIEEEANITAEVLRRLLDHSKKLATFEQKARLVRDAIQDVLDADDDLAGMYLTDRKNGTPRAVDNHEEAELLLESYHKVCDEIFELGGKIQDDVRKTDEAIKSILDANRNEILLLDVKINMGMLGIASGTLVAGLYGMNLINYFEEAKYGFVGITGFCLFICGFVIFRARTRLWNVQKHRIVLRSRGEGPPWMRHRRATSWGSNSSQMEQLLENQNKQIEEMLERQQKERQQ